MTLLIQFLLRLAFGLATAMAATSPRLVTAGYFRVHAYVLMGMTALAAMAAFGGPEPRVFAFATTAAVISYLASVIWLYAKHRLGIAALVLVAICTLAGACFGEFQESDRTFAALAMIVADVVSGGLLLGATMAAMLLGHWYLNTPTMQLTPLRRLVMLMSAAAVLRAVICGWGVAGCLFTLGPQPTSWWLFVALRWISGLAGLLVLAWMTWQTLKIPNTQSATGILYVGVIVTFLGELSSLLLSVESPYPL